MSWSKVIKTSIRVLNRDVIESAIMEKATTIAVLTLIIVIATMTTSTSVLQSSSAKTKNDAISPTSSSTGGPSKKDLKDLSDCQSKSAKSGELTQQDVDNCYAETFPNAPTPSNGPQPSATPSNVPQPSSTYNGPQPSSTYNGPQPSSTYNGPQPSATPSNGPQPVSGQNSTLGKSLSIDSNTIKGIIKNRFGL